MKEGNGDDNLAIAWQYPGQPRVVIPAKFSRLELIEVNRPPPIVSESQKMLKEEKNVVNQNPPSSADLLSINQCC